MLAVAFRVLPNVEHQVHYGLFRLTFLMWHVVLLLIVLILNFTVIIIVMIMSLLRLRLRHLQVTMMHTSHYCDFIVRAGAHDAGVC